MMETAERILIALNSLVPIRLGSLWHIKESFWQKNPPTTHYRSDRSWHPGLAVEGKSFSGMRDTFRVLFGSSRFSSSQAVVVRGITRERGPQYETYFSVVKPVGIAPAALLGEEPEVSPNFDKPMADESEKQQLRQFLLKKGVLFNE